MRLKSLKLRLGESARRPSRLSRSTRPFNASRVPSFLSESRKRTPYSVYSGLGRPLREWDEEEATDWADDTYLQHDIFDVFYNVIAYECDKGELTGSAHWRGALKPVLNLTSTYYTPYADLIEKFKGMDEKKVRLLDDDSYLLWKLHSLAALYYAKCVHTLETYKGLNIVKNAFKSCKEAYPEANYVTSSNWKVNKYYLEQYIKEADEIYDEFVKKVYKPLTESAKAFEKDWENLKKEAKRLGSSFFSSTAISDLSSDSIHKALEKFFDKNYDDSMYANLDVFCNIVKSIGNDLREALAELEKMYG